MKCLILANGEYGDLTHYEKHLTGVDVVICADGGANYAYQLQLIPDYIVGDMDSIEGEVRKFFLENHEVNFRKYPQQKDFTDTQLAISIAEDLGVSELVFFGTQGNRIDHTLSNLYSCIEMCDITDTIVHYNPECSIYITSKPMVLTGKRGETISVLALTDMVSGFSLSGVEYPLNSAVLQKSNPYTISNILEDEQAAIIVAEGIAAIFHYHHT